MLKQSPLVRWLDKASALGFPSQISVSGWGSISVYPEKQVYATDITDWEPSSFPESTPVHDKAMPRMAPPDNSLPISELRWRAMYWFARSNIDRERAPLMVRLCSWPDLADVPEDLAPGVARICALLVCKPTAPALLSKVVAMELEPTLVLLRVLIELGHVSAFERVANSSHDESAQSEASLAEPAQQQASSMLSKLWQRLSRR